MSFTVLAAFALTGLSALVSGAVLLTVRSGRLSGALLAVAGLADLTAVSMQSTGRGVAAALFFSLAVDLGVAALVVFPTVRTADAVDFLALTAVAAIPVATLVADLTSGRGQPGYSLSGVAAGVLVLYTWWRLEHTQDWERRPLWWMALAAGSALTVVLLAIFLDIAEVSSVSAIVSALALAAVGPAVAIGARSPEILEVRALVVRVVVLITAVMVYLTLFLTATSFLEVLGGPRLSASGYAIVGALCAAAFHPLQVVLTGVIDELLFGHRPDPLGAASQVMDGLGDEPEAALRVLREALMVPHVRLVVDGAVLASSGVPVTDAVPFPLQLGDGITADLEVGLRAGDLALGENDLWVLRMVSPLLAQTLRVRRLAAEVQASRESTVAALEEERRRLRRDLHDGLGPRLAGIAFSAQAARNTLHGDPEGADALLAGLRTQAAEAIREIRELVYDMRPPALDELGLAAAIRQRASAIGAPDGRRFDVVVEAEELPHLPAAVEVAAYRIVLEGLTNAARHSGADAATATLAIRGEALVVEVRDCGRGGVWRPGVGLSAMRERAAELGGEFTAGGRAGGGLVSARLPLAGTG